MKWALFILILFLFSCEPQRERCAICTTTIYADGDVEGYEFRKKMACGEELEYLDGLVQRITPGDNGECITISITRCK
jgi:hypothetical protein